MVPFCALPFFEVDRLQIHLFTNEIVTMILIRGEGREQHNLTDSTIK